MEKKYEDMVYMPHHVSLRHPHMIRRNRAAQFAPFAALTGHEESIDEVARYVEEKIELDDNKKEQINQKLMDILNKPQEERKAIVTFFKKDTCKKGGSYLTRMAMIDRFDYYKDNIIIEGRYSISIDDVYEINIIK